MATANATPPKMTLDRTDGSATIALYRAALGPLHTDYYLKAFTRFDAAGKTGPLWNWAAALLTLNWMVFRQLWAAALAYAGAVIATALLLLGIARLVFQVSAEVQWLLLGLAALLAIGLPGAFGNTWLYAACNRKMERALVECATLEEACALLAGKAASRQRMGGLLAGNVVLGAALTALALSWPSAGSLPFNPGQQARTLPVEQQQSGLATQSVGALSAPAASAVSEPALPASSAASALPAAAASAPAAAIPTIAAPLQPEAHTSRVSQGMVQAAVPVAAAPTMALAAAPTPTPTPPPALAAATVAPLAPPAAPAATKALAPEPAKPAANAQPAPEPDKKPEPAKQTRAEKAALKAQAAKEAKAAKAEKKLALLKEKQAKEKDKEAKKATASAKPQAAKPLPEPAISTRTEEKYLINVGLFADENNARNAFTKLKDAGLPALSQELKSSKGPRTRVRVGPFETQAEADRAAEKIRSMQLEAAVFKQ